MSPVLILNLLKVRDWNQLNEFSLLDPEKVICCLNIHMLLLWEQWISINVKAENK